MEWQDEAIILGVRPHGETSAIVEVMSRRHGRHLGVVKGGRSRRQQPLMQPGNGVEAHWWARLDEHIGTFRLEAVDFAAARMMGQPLALYALQTFAAHLRLLPERDPHPALYEALQLLTMHFATPALVGEILLRFELRLLQELGFGLDLSCCAATGTREELIYVSPRSGRAVSREAGLPWKDKLLALPVFLHQTGSHADCVADFQDGFRLTGFFLERHVWQARGLEAPSARESVINRLCQKTGVDETTQ